MGPTCVLSAPAGPHVGSMNLAIRVYVLNGGEDHNSSFVQMIDNVWIIYWHWTNTKPLPESMVIQFADAVYRTLLTTPKWCTRVVNNRCVYILYNHEIYFNSMCPVFSFLIFTVTLHKPYRVSEYQQLDCLFITFCRLATEKKTDKAQCYCHYVMKTHQMACNTESVSLSWRHHEDPRQCLILQCPWFVFDSIPIYKSTTRCLILKYLEPEYIITPIEYSLNDFIPTVLQMPLMPG